MLPSLAVLLVLEANQALEYISVVARHPKDLLLLLLLKVLSKQGIPSESVVIILLLISSFAQVLRDLLLQCVGIVSARCGTDRRSPFLHKDLSSTLLQQDRLVPNVLHGLLLDALLPKRYIAVEDESRRRRIMVAPR